MIENLFTAFINLDHRVDRLIHMKKELTKAGIEAVRWRGMLPQEYTGDKSKVAVMQARTPGAIGCHYSQVAVMQEALNQGKHAFVMEDDLVFCDDFKERLAYIDKFLETHQWDIMWLGATFHVNPPYWHTGKNLDLPLTDVRGRDAVSTSDPRIFRTFGAFCTYAYIVNKDSIRKVLDMLDSVVHMSMGIDWAMIKIQPELMTYAFVPGSVKQMDNPSDIGKPNGTRKAFTTFSNFSKINGTTEKSKYWWQKKMTDFDPLTCNWAEAKL
jgi:GR25 family glycosyltransferase involved in LPS biosynthesis